MPIALLNLGFPDWDYACDKASGAETNLSNKDMTSRINKEPKKTASKRKGEGPKKVLKRSQLMKLFEDELKDIYWAEKALTKALPKMVKNTSSPELAEAIQNHLEQTMAQIARLEEVFDILGKKAVAKKCEAMAGLVREGEEIMEETERGPQRDAGIISAAQKAEHYEIASYGTLRTFARTLGLNDAALLLEETLEEEKHADDIFSGLAESGINTQALDEDED